MCLLAFEGKNKFKVYVLKAMKFLAQIWISVSVKSLQNCCIKVRFASTSKENQETANEPENDTEEI